MSAAPSPVKQAPFQKTIIGLNVKFQQETTEFQQKALEYLLPALKEVLQRTKL
jgi:hypothetical protein